jgi:hypothetical protein
VKEDDDDEAKSKGGSLFKTNDGKEMEKKKEGGVLSIYMV